MIPNFGWIMEKKLAGSGDVAGWQSGNTSIVRQNLAWLEEQGLRAIVTLTESSLDGSVLNEFDIVYKHMPITDMSAPQLSSIIEFVAFSGDCIERNKPVLVHCSAGLGRTGTMLSCFLVNTGMDPLDAITKVRQTRPGSVETLEQEMRIIEYADLRGSD